MIDLQMDPRASRDEQGMRGATPPLPSFDEIVRRESRHVWRALRRYGVPERLCADALQEVFAILHRRLPELDGQERIGAWLMGVARRVAAKFRQRDQREPLMNRDESKSPPMADPQADPETAIADREILLKLLDTLPQEQRDVWVMHELEQLTVPEIAAELSIPEGTAATRLRIARRDLEAARVRLAAQDSRGAILPLAALIELEKAEPPPVPEGVVESTLDHFRRIDAAKRAPGELGSPAPRRTDWRIVAISSTLAFVLGTLVGPWWRTEREPRAPPSTPPPIATAPASPPSAPAPSAPPTVDMEIDLAPPPASAGGAALSDLVQERALLDKVSRALAEGDSGEALALLQSHARRFPRGALAEEREATWVQVLARAGRTADAQARLTRYARAFPRSNRLDELRRSLGQEPVTP